MYLPDNTCDWPETVREVVGDTGGELTLGLPSELKAEKIILVCETLYMYLINLITIQMNVNLDNLCSKVFT